MSARLSLVRVLNVDSDSIIVGVDRLYWSSSFTHSASAIFRVVFAPVGQRQLQHIIELGADVVVGLVVWYSRIASHQRILRSYVQRVVHLPVDVTHFARGME